MKSCGSSFETNSAKILLVGDTGRVFLDSDTIRELPCKIYNNMVDAIDAAAREQFAVIGVVMDGPPAKLNWALRALREASCEAKIVLLVQMYEEPAAIQLVGSLSNGERIVDDYLICPLGVNRFCESIESIRSRRAVGPAERVTVDAKTEAKIKELEKLATEDDLTGLKNRRYIREFTRQIIERAREKSGQVTLLVFDIDNFKHYNDVYGHAAGDEILRQAAALIRRCCRGHDVVGRVGGDEFAVVFWDELHSKEAGSETERRSALAEHPAEAIFIATRFRRELEKTELDLLGPEGKGVLTISGGLARFACDSSTAEELFEQADKALLEAKRSGKNRIYLVGRPESDIADIE